MKKYLSVKLTGYAVVAFTALVIISSCNKKLAAPTPIIFPTQGTQSILEVITADPTYSYFLAGVVKAGTSGRPDSILALLRDKTNTMISVYAPNDAAFRASGISSIAFLQAAFRAGQLDSLIRYWIIPGEQWLQASNVPTTFPNIQLPSMLTVGPIPGTILPFRLSVYPSRRTSGMWLNNIPLVAADKICNNGVLHTLGALVAPPSLVLAQIIGSDPNLTFFNALVARGDVGATDPTKRFAYALSLPFANLTVFAPNNTAVRGFLIVISGGIITPTTPDATVIGFIQKFILIRLL